MSLNSKIAMSMSLLELLKQRGLFVQANFEAELAEQLQNSKLNFYVGFDPTAPSLHIGNYVLIHTAKLLQQYGHIPHIVLGNATAQIGDPTGRMELRQMLDQKTITKNTNNIKRQIRHFLGDVVFYENYAWLKKLNYINVIRELGICFSVNKMLATDAFSARWERGLTLMELNYMVLQAYDFYHLFNTAKINLQIGGRDQWTNILAGVDLIRRKHRTTTFGMTVDLLTKADGQKMGKSATGALWLDKNKTSPFDFYQYWINLDDQSLEKAFLMLTDIEMTEVKQLCSLKGSSIKTAKEKLAFTLTQTIHGKRAAELAQKRSALVFSQQPDLDIKTVKTNSKIIDIIVEHKLVNSKSEARRVIQQGGLTVNNQKVIDEQQQLSYSREPIIIRKGKKTFITVKVEE